ncbi:YdgH/BhsA/McbA-like domain containing protein [Serratia sp. D1N4]
MKSLKMTVAALVVGLASFSTMAATLLTQEDLDKAPGKYEKIGMITSTAQATDPMDLKEELSKLADEKGGKYYVVVAAREHGRFSAAAEVYKDKK